GLIGLMSAAEHFERLAIVAGVSERTTIGAEHAHMARILDRGLLEHCDGLRTLAVAAQRMRIIDRGLRIFRVGAVALAPAFRRAVPFIRPAGRGSGGERARRLPRLYGLS